jgi:hypothetical protein
VDHEQAVEAAAARLEAARVEHQDAETAYRAAVNAWAASLTEIRPGDLVDRVSKWGTPVERRGESVTRWRVDVILGKRWGGNAPEVRLLCTYIGKDGQPGKRTAEITAEDVRPVT